VARAIIAKIAKLDVVGPGVGGWPEKKRGEFLNGV
jgi:hypothetical protein